MARLMLVLGLVLSLAACGGSGTDGLSKAEEDALEARVEAAEADKVAAEADKVAAEADKVAAELDKVAAELAKDAAEADKDAAELAKDAAVAAKDVAVAAKDVAVAAQAAAELAKDAAELDKVAAELAKDAAVAAKDVAVAAKDVAVAAQAAAELAEDAADEAKVAADLALVRAVAAKESAENEAQLQLRSAQVARQEATDARQEATDAREEARVAREEARVARGLAETAQQAQERLAAEAKAARQQARQTEAGVALRGLSGESLTPSETTVTVAAKYKAPALVRAPGVTFTSPRGSSAGKWYATTLSNRGATYQDEMVVYSDVGRGVSTAIDEAHAGFEPILETSLLMISIVNEDHKGLVTSTQFPRTASTKPIPLNDYSMRDDDPLTVDMKDMARFSGYFDRARGEFRCIGSGNIPCTVQYTGENYLLGAGDWTFRTSKNSKVTVPDEQYMYFGWWRRQTIDDGTFAYGPFSGTEGATPTGPGLRGLEGTAVYEGPAIGQYAIYAPLSPVSNHGSFNATARLTANFDDATTTGSISGSITGFDATGFDANPGWAVTLQNTSIDSGGTISGGTVSWMIDGNTEADGAWKGEFHADVKTYIDTYPDGVTGTFDATYTTVGEMIGAFGAHKK